MTVLNGSNDMPSIVDESDETSDTVKRFRSTDRFLNKGGNKILNEARVRYSIHVILLLSIDWSVVLPFVRHQPWRCWICCSQCERMIYWRILSATLLTDTT